MVVFDSGALRSLISDCNEGAEKREADKQVYAVVIFVVIAITVIIVITLITIAMVIVAALHIPNHILIHATSGA